MVTRRDTLTKEDLTEALKPIIDRLDGMDKRLDGVDKRLDRMEGKLDGLIKAVPGANPGVNT